MNQIRISAQFLGLDMVYSEEEAKKVFDKCSFLSQSKEIAKDITQ